MFSLSSTRVQAALLLLSFAAPRAVYATLYQSADAAVSKFEKTNYDYIIVGGGAAGGVLANRLSETSTAKVLLIEAGGSDYQVQDIEMPFVAPTLARTSIDWNYTTSPQIGLNDRTFEYERGKILGGSTSLNFMIFTRGSEDDYDRFAKTTGDDGWNWNNMYQYLLKLENFTNSPLVESPDTKYNPKLHSTSGPVGVGLPPITLPTDTIGLTAQTQLASEFPFNLDVNSGDMIGFSWMPFAIQGGVRSGSARDYIQPALGRSNLDVIVNTQVTKLVKTGTSGGAPVVRGVQLSAGPGAKVYSLTANKEVLVTGGSIGSPQLLLLSGIGPAEQSKALGIPTLVDLPDVGQNLQDHPLLASHWAVKSNNTLDNLRLNATFEEEQATQWADSHTGELTLGGGNQWIWGRLPPNSSIFQTAPDPSAGPTSPHYQLIFSDYYIDFSGAPFPDGHFLTLLSNVYSPASRGNITLKSSNPFDYPIINPALFSDPGGFDLFAVREALRAGRRFLNAPAWSSWLDGETSASASATTDDEIDAYIHANAMTIQHISGTVAMGKPGTVAKGSGALNPDLTVKGTVGLRVIDASSFPFVPASHTMVPIYALAERAADLIKSSSESKYPTTFSS